MTLQEVLKLGRRFRRENDMYWVRPFIGTDSFVFSKADIEATDWIAEEKKVTITKNDVIQVIERAKNNPAYFGTCLTGILLSELGLQD